jgi:hypothetical protein
MKIIFIFFFFVFLAFPLWAGTAAGNSELNGERLI